MKEMASSDVCCALFDPTRVLYLRSNDIRLRLVESFAETHHGHDVLVENIRKSPQSLEGYCRLLRLARFTWYQQTSLCVQLTCSGLELLPLDVFCADKATLRVLVDELNKIEPLSTVAIDTLKRVSLALFRSEKLLLRRSGLELLGDLAKSLVWTYSLPKAQVDQWFRKEAVLESVFMTRPDDRITPMAEDLIVHITLTNADIENIISRPASLAIQALIHATIHHTAFTENLTAHMMTFCAERALTDLGYRSFLFAILGSRPTQTIIIRKGPKCNLIVLKAILYLLLLKADELTDDDSKAMLSAMTYACSESDNTSKILH